MCAIDPEFDQNRRVSSNGDGNGSNDVNFVHAPTLAIGGVDSTKHIAGCNCCEEGHLWFLQHLNKPDVGIVCVTSMPVAPCIIDHCLDFLCAGNNASFIKDAKERLSMVTCGCDPDEELLCNKMTMRPLLMTRIKNDIVLPPPERVKMFSHCQTNAEDDIAEQLGIKVCRNNPKSACWGTKVESCVAFKESDVPHCFGVHDSLESVNAVAESIIVFAGTLTRSSRSDGKIE